MKGLTERLKELRGWAVDPAWWPPLIDVLLQIVLRLDALEASVADLGSDRACPECEGTGCDRSYSGAVVQCSECAGTGKRRVTP